jgi:hypothetical protein
MSPASDDPTCALCNDPVEVEDWCFECRAFVCADCVGEGSLLMGSHKVEDHREVQ